MKVYFTNITPVPMGGKAPGERFRLETDENGIPLKRYWRNRLQDNEIEADKPEPSPPPAPKKSASTSKGS